jgi:hypothetical protein
MILIDRMIIGGIKFVLGKIADAVDEQLDDEGRLHEDLLAAQMRRELGEIDDAELARVEAEVMARLREIRERRGGGEASAQSRLGDRFKVVGVEASVGGDDGLDERAGEPQGGDLEAPARERRRGDARRPRKRPRRPRREAKR